jgi:hypothetical protein
LSVGHLGDLRRDWLVIRRYETVLINDYMVGKMYQ